ncbi:MAG: hypothetical protein KM310_10380 [Clostridiales bacterium]|nr:hypothetical protein [Clostridiales bacterium]
MLYLFAATLGLLFLAYLAADALLHSVRHTARSRRVLMAYGLVASGVALLINLVFLRTFPLWARLLLFILMAGLLFVFSGYAAIYRWRLQKLRQFDMPLEEMRRDLQRLLAQYDQLTWEIRRLERSARLPAPSRPARDPGDEWQRVVVQWESEPGMARIRSLKTKEWREEAAGLDDGALEERRRSLMDLREKSSGEKRAQIEVQLAIVELERLARRRQAPEEERQDGLPPAGLEELKRRRDEVEREARELSAAIEELQRRRESYLRQPIPLD